ncbi:DNA-binding transcriptional regulator LsrR (DeoR family) [Symbiobacterium terraclitae]|uniref:DNA-binding transcriptional regulator LsrR (DeoR family) n=1 Tax=Symbiobacterium terraclitae TaxID=557451 RepID=A0ABS4JVE4_9FIRM|nr:sugar-binding transcriptional regulator [Symbiobacterium terraclitae]MBP2018951.1 DNA-binding transcriptional regulator LsrR (DeoR family) [Symbiobacterium terraclitae]
MQVHSEADLKVLVAWMYYDEGLTHEKIAHRLNLSRVAVTRLLQKARKEGIVQIQITRPLPVQFKLEQQLEATFGLKRAVVVKTYGDWRTTLDALGRAGAQYLRSLLFPGCRLGVAWSETVRSIIPYLQRPKQPLQGTVNELVGTRTMQTNPFSVSVQLADALGMPLEAIPVPVVVQSKAARDAILSEESIRTAMEHARQVDVAVVGLGDVGPECTMVRTGHLQAADVAVLRERGAVGDMLMRFYDSQGRHVPGPLEECVISLEWSEIRRLPHIVAMAGGPRKVEAILGALRGGLCHSLITDSDTARNVLERAGVG